MPESVLVCLDTSEWMRNGDYAPTRLAAQYDAATLVCTAVLGQNPENAVGVLSFGGKTVNMLASPCEDEMKLLAVIGSVRAGGNASFTRGLKTAMLACKNNKSKHARQRIMMFVGSPVDATLDEAAALGTALRRGGIGVDIVMMGENATNAERLTRLVSDANKEGNSHLYDVPLGVMPADMLTPVLMGGGTAGGPASAAAPGGGGQGNTHAEFGGVDPSLDPELAMALRASLEEHRAAQRATDGAAAPASAPAASTEVPMGEDDELLAQALRMSMADDAGGAAASASSASAAPASETAAARTSDGGVAGSTSAAAPAPGSADFVASVLQSMEGVDINDPDIQAALAALAGPPAPNPGDGGDGGSGGADGKRPS